MAQLSRADQVSAVNDGLAALSGRVTESVWKTLPCSPQDSRARHVSAVGSRGLCDPRVTGPQT